MTSLQKESDCCENCIGYENEWTPENLVCCKEDCMCHSQKESEWEKMTHKDWFPVVGGGPECENCGAHGYEKYDICPVAVDEAINTAVSNREKEIAEEVKKLYSLDYMKGSPASYINRALDKVLQILKH